MFQRIAFLFPGQGAQYVGMGRSFYDEHSVARTIFENADDILQTNLSQIIFNGPKNALTETKTAQPAIFVTSLAILTIVQHAFDLPPPVCTAGLSLGEYTALTAAGALNFEDGLKLVSLRAKLMHEACEVTAGGMLAIMGLTNDQVREMVANAHMPNDLWCANFNCPGQVVVSGTLKGLETASQAAKALGAKRVLPLQVHGAFHSGLMQTAQQGLKNALEHTVIKKPEIPIAMNVTGQFVHEPEEIRQCLISQVTSSVLWHQCIQTCAQQNLSCFIEIGCGKTLAGMNKRIGVSVPTCTIETTDDLMALKSISTTP